MWIISSDRKSSPRKSSHKAIKCLPTSHARAINSDKNHPCLGRLKLMLCRSKSLKAGSRVLADARCIHVCWPYNKIWMIHTAQIISIQRNHYRNLSFLQADLCLTCHQYNTDHNRFGFKFAQMGAINQHQKTANNMFDENSLLNNSVIPMNFCTVTQKKSQTKMPFPFPINFPALNSSACAIELQSTPFCAYASSL